MFGGCTYFSKKCGVENHNAVSDGTRVVCGSVVCTENVVH